jgi:amino acid permease
MKKPEKKPRSWLNRTFSKMEKGGIRGNIFLLLITTAGCSFFYLPYYSKKCGVLLTFLLLIIPAVLSYYSR